MIRLTLHLWLKLHPDLSDALEFEIQDVWKSAKEKLLLIQQIAFGQSTLSRPDIIDIVMHDVNIEETKLETLILALLIFSWLG